MKRTSAAAAAWAAPGATGRACFIARFIARLMAGLMAGSRSLTSIVSLLATSACLLASAPGSALAQASARDPMHPLPTRAAPAAAGGGQPAAAPEAPVARQLLLIDGRRYVVEGLRRRAVGEMLGNARIERIEDSAVTVVDAKGVRRRLPLFAGVVKRPVATADAAPAPSGPSGSVNPARPSRPAGLPQAAHLARVAGASGSTTTSAAASTVPPRVGAPPLFISSAPGPTP